MSNHTYRRPLAAAMVSLCLLAGGAGVANAATLSPTSVSVGTIQHATYSGEALYDGVFFDRGPVAAQHPDLAVLKRSLTPAQGAVVDSVKAQIAKDNPTFFSSFAASMQSGDRFQIKNSLISAANATKQAADELGVKSTDVTPNLLLLLLVVVIFVAAAAEPADMALPAGLTLDRYVNQVAAEL